MSTPEKFLENYGLPEVECPDAVAAEYSEIALADEFTRQCGDTWRYVAVWGKWFTWTGSVWREDDRMEVWDRARRVVEQASAALASKDKKSPAKAIATVKTVWAVIRLASADPKHAAIVGQWDANPWLLNTPGGMVDLCTGERLASDPLAYCTKITAATPADHVPGDCLWLRFLWRVCGDDRDLVRFLKHAAGYSLTGSTREEMFFFLYGLGQNGKSKFVEAVSGAMGSYHQSAAMETFISSKYESHSTDLAMLRGARMVTASETENGRRWAESKIKAITGGDAISARFMRMDNFTFKPQLKLWIAGNHKPGLRNVDFAMRRRMNLIPFTVTIPEAERDRDLSAKLKAEWPIVLRWMIDGCLEWQRDGLNPPGVVTVATDEYMTGEDVVRQWLDECCEVGNQFRGSFAVLWASWQAWAERSGEHVGTKKRFGQTLQDRNFIAEHTRAGRMYGGLATRGNE